MIMIMMLIVVVMMMMMMILMFRDHFEISIFGGLLAFRRVIFHV